MGRLRLKMTLFRNLSLGVTALALIFSLAGCFESKQSYSYLMLHPEHLQKLYNQCVQQVVAPELPCELIMRAEADFTQLTNQREQDPERFGARVLQDQENSIFLKSKLDSAWQAYQIVGAAKPTIENLKTMRMALDKAESEYETSSEGVKILLAVIAATSSV